MIIVKLQGGLGNQMFQFAAGRGFQHGNENIYLDLSFLEENQFETEHFTPRQYELGIFENIKAQRASDWQSKLFNGSSIFIKILRLLFKNSFQYIQQQGTDFTQVSKRNRKVALLLDGYFQSESFFKDYREDILNDFQFPLLDPVNSEIKNRIKSVQNPVSIHVRRGDYLKSKSVTDIHGVLPLSYYHKALDILKDKYPSLTLFVFSDDPSWVNSNFNKINIERHFIDHNKGLDCWKDMALMSYCNHNIIANSSFSWWGAWLNPNPEKMVIAPKNWFADPVLNEQAKSIVPENWIKI